MTAIALIQPLPALRFPNATGISEFPSLGLSILARAIAATGHDVTLHHPATNAEVESAAAPADVVVLGDFRYYAYFCNPAPLIERSLRVLEDAGFDGRLVVGGRHSPFLEVATSRRHLTVVPTAKQLYSALGLEPPGGDRAAVDPLPPPALATTSMLVDPTLGGSASRPTRNAPGQVIVRSGCRYRCGFCEKAGTVGGRLNTDDLGTQLAELRAASVEYVIAWDEVFVDSSPEVAGRVLAAFADAGLSFGCNTRFDTLCDANIDALVEAGCRSVLVGVEAEPEDHGKHRYLHTDTGKRPSSDAYRRLNDRLREAGMSPVASAIVGLPQDDSRAVVKRVAYIAELGFDHVYARPLVPFPESRLYREAVTSGRLPVYSEWNAAALDSFPYGYPVTSPIPRDELWDLIRRPP